MFLPLNAMLAWYVRWSCVRPSVRQSVCLSHRITKMMPRNSLGIWYFTRYCSNTIKMWWDN